VATDWLQDGKSIVYASGADAGTDVGRFTLSGGGAPQPLVHLATVLPASHVSPDAHWMAYTAPESGMLQVFVTSFPDARGRWRISPSGGNEPRWSRDGRDLFYLSADRKLMMVTVRRGPRFAAGAAMKLLDRPVADYAVGRDGRFLIEIPAAAATSPPITVVLNWQAALKN
jgi:Tol biopolymer transport system component